jgi:hypothetical protein
MSPSVKNEGSTAPSSFAPGLEFQTNVDRSRSSNPLSTGLATVGVPNALQQIAARSRVPQEEIDFSFEIQHGNSVIQLKALANSSRFREVRENFHVGGSD